MNWNTACIDYIENQTRSNNLRIDGVAEVTAEAWADTEAVVRKILATALKLPENRRARYELNWRTGQECYKLIGPTEDRRREV